MRIFKNIIFMMFIASSISILSGCISPQEYMASLEATCRGYGFQKGTSQFSQCLQQADSQNRANEAARNAAAQQAFSSAQQQLKGNGSSSGSTNCYRTPGVPKSVYCQ